VASASQPEKILIVRLSALGDVIQTLPLPAAIRRSMPQAKIGWAIDASLLSAIHGHRDIDYIHVCPRSRWQAAALDPLRWPHVLRELNAFARDIRAVGYDLAIDAQGLLISALIPFLAGIRRRVGFDHRRELSHFFYTEKYVSKREYFASGTMHSEHMLALARAIGCDTSGCQAQLPEVLPHVRAGVAALLDQAFGNGGALIALAPGTQWVSKRWPVEYWRELLEAIVTRTKANVVLVGARDDAPAAAELLQSVGDIGATRILNLAGKTTVPELYALMARVSVTIAPDTAPLHVAGAARCAHLIGVYGPTPGGRTGPGGSPDIRLLSATPALHCQPCRRPRCRYGTNQCMRNVAPADVLAALAPALRERADFAQC
jgi:lipopolysaccharide heptosyltransferase II